MKGILLAGGTGSRLWPMTRAASKQLLPVYDKPLIYYPLTTLMLAGIRDILVITAKHDQAQFTKLLGDGSQWGISLSYLAQESPEGLAQAFILGREFIGGGRCAMVLGDNVFHGQGLREHLRDAADRQTGATVFGYYVKDPRQFGVAEFDESGQVKSLEEKPSRPRSHYAVVGLYFYDERVCDFASSLKPSARGELEITDLNRCYLDRGELRLIRLGRGFAWLDTGTPESILQAANYMETLENRQGLKVSVPEEVAWRLGFITSENLAELAHSYGTSGYGSYLRSLLDAQG